MSDIASQLFEVEHGQFGGDAPSRAKDVLEWAQCEVERVAATMNVISASLGSVRRGVGASIRDADLESCLVLLEGRLRASSKAMNMLYGVEGLMDYVGQDGVKQNKAE